MGKGISIVYATAFVGGRCIEKCFNSFIDNLGVIRYMVNGIEVTKEEGNEEYLKLKELGTADKGFHSYKVR